MATRAIDNLAAPDGRQVSIAELGERARGGDEAAFLALMERLRPQMHGHALRLIGVGRDDDGAAAEDLVQDAIVKVYGAIRRLPQAAFNPQAYVHRVLHNAGLDIVRRRQRLRWQSWEDGKHDQLRVERLDDPEVAALRHETRRAVQRALDRMGHRHRLALVLRAYQGLSCEEIGEVMGLSRSAVKAVLYRARQEFREVWAALEGDGERGTGERWLGRRPPDPRPLSPDPQRGA